MTDELWNEVHEIVQETGMEKQEVKKHLEKQTNLALEYRMK